MQSAFSFGNMQCLDMDCDKVLNIECCVCSDTLVEILYDFAWLYCILLNRVETIVTLYLICLIWFDLTEYQMYWSLATECCNKISFCTALSSFTASFCTTTVYHQPHLWRWVHWYPDEASKQVLIFWCDIGSYSIAWTCSVPLQQYCY